MPAALWESLNDERMVVLKGCVALAATVLLAWRWRSGTASFGRGPKVWAALFSAVALAAVLCFWNLGRFHFPVWLHSWDVYGNYVGAKYFPELGYTRIYACVALADSENVSLADVRGRRIRNLVTNKLELADPVLNGPAECRGRFTDERWRSFKQDVAFFRAINSQERWYEMQHDHGYNGTPVWGLVAGFLSNQGPATERQMSRLTALDPILLAVLWGFAVWAFGWQAAGVAAVFWGTNYMARFWWNGGAFLRMDWLAASVIAVCLLKAGKPRASGFAFACAGLLRVFPFVLVAGLLLGTVGRSLRSRRLVVSEEEKRLGQGFVLAILFLVSLSAAVLGPGAWTGFVENSRKHLSTPLTNNVGLKTALAFPFSQRASVSRRLDLFDPFGDWKASRVKAERRTTAAFVLIAAAFAALAARAAERQPAWVAAALGACLVPVFTQLTCYYESVLLVAGFLWLVHPAVGVLLTSLAVATCALPSIWWWDDQRFFAASVLCLVFAAAAFSLVWAAGSRAGPAPAANAARPPKGRRRPTGRSRA